MHYCVFIFLILTNCWGVIDEKRMIKENTHEDIKTLATAIPHSQPKPRLQKPRQEQQKIHPIFYKKISITLHENAPFQSILTQAASQIGASILIDHHIRESVYYTAKNKPFIDVIEDLAENLKLRFTIKGTFIKLEKDTPYTKTYPVNFLKFERESYNNISTTTDIFNEHDKKPHTKNNSGSEINVKSLINFWDELKKGLAFYIGDDHFNINQQSGLVIVTGTDKQHKFVGAYLDQLEKSANAQVLIEAKIIEVKLNQEFNTGIDWEWFSKQQTESIDFKGALNFKSANFTFILKALEKFGSLRTVSSPRLVLLNNQTSMIKVAENSIFFKMDFQSQYLGIVENPNQPNADHERFKTMSTSEIKSKPIGFIMPIQASIQPEKGKILLFVRPTVSRHAGSVKDPALEFNARSAKITQDIPESKVPVVEVREMDSVLKLDNGDTTILGGLTIIKSHDKSTGIMRPASFDKARSALGAQDLQEEVYELVILIKATIIEDENNTTTQNLVDERLQKDFVRDSRPFYNTPSS